MRSPRAAGIESTAFRSRVQYGVAVATPSPSSLQLRFTATWNGAPLSGVSRVSGLRRTVDVVEYRESTASGDLATTKLPGDVTFEPVALERAVTGDGAFATIADAAASPGPGASHRGTLIVSLHDQPGRLVLACTLHRAWVSSYDVFAGLDAHGDDPVVERITFVPVLATHAHAPAVREVLDRRADGGPLVSTARRRRHGHAELVLQDRRPVLGADRPVRDRQVVGAHTETVATERDPATDPATSPATPAASPSSSAGLGLQVAAPRREVGKGPGRRDASYCSSPRRRHRHVRRAG